MDSTSAKPCLGLCASYTKPAAKFHSDQCHPCANHVAEFDGSGVVQCRWCDELPVVLGLLPLASLADFTCALTNGSNLFDFTILPPTTS